MISEAIQNRVQLNKANLPLESTSPSSLQALLCPASSLQHEPRSAVVELSQIDYQILGGVSALAINLGENTQQLLVETDELTGHVVIVHFGK